MATVDPDERRDAAAYAEEEAMKRNVPYVGRPDSERPSIADSTANTGILDDLSETPSNAQLKQELWKISRARKQQLDRIEEKLDTLLARLPPERFDDDEWEQAYAERVDD